MKTLNVQRITRDILRHHWGSCTDLVIGYELYIRSNAKGEINWREAPVYNWDEIQKESLKRRVCFTVNPEVFKLPEPLK